MAKPDRLIADFHSLNGKQAEAVAKLCWFWNDLLSDGASGARFTKGAEWLEESASWPSTAL